MKFILTTWSLTNKQGSYPPNWPRVHCLVNWMAFNFKFNLISGNTRFYFISGKLRKLVGRTLQLEAFFICWYLPEDIKLFTLKEQSVPQSIHCFLNEVYKVSKGVPLKMKKWATLVRPSKMMWYGTRAWGADELCRQQCGKIRNLLFVCLAIFLLLACFPFEFCKV